MQTCLAFVRSRNRHMRDARTTLRQPTQLYLTAYTSILRQSNRFAKPSPAHDTTDSWSSSLPNLLLSFGWA
jgi:hypothetical protein